MKDYMTSEEVQEYFDISKATLYNWRSRGLIFSKIGGKIFFSKEDLNNFLNDRKMCEYGAWY